MTSNLPTTSGLPVTFGLPVTSDLSTTSYPWPSACGPAVPRDNTSVSLNSSLIYNLSSPAASFDPCSCIAAVAEISPKFFARDVFGATEAYVFGFLYVLVMLLGFVGNLSVIIVLRKRRKKQHVTELLILVLAGADLLVVALTMPLQLLYHLRPDSPFNLQGCRFLELLQAGPVVAGIFTLTAIAVERYTMVVVHERLRQKPVGYYSRKATILGISLASVITVAPSLPGLQAGANLLYIDASAESLCLREVTRCTERATGSDVNLRVYTWVTFGLLFVFPVVIITYCYAVICFKLRGKRQETYATRGSYTISHFYIRSVKQRQKTIRVMVAMVITFFVCWTPKFTFLFAKHIINTDSETSEVFYKYWLIEPSLTLLGYLNCCLNPLIYTFMNSRYRQDLKKMLRRPGRRFVHVIPRSTCTTRT